MKSMTTTGSGLALLLLVLSLLAVSQTQGQEDVGSKYVGTWRIVSATYGGQEFDVSRLGVTLKHITPTQFTWLSYDKETGKISRAGGGKYTLEGTSCKESIQYGFGDDYEVIKDKEQSLQIKVDGDKLYSKGKLSNGREISEVWERVK
jgi:hypothetical protein